MTGLVACTAGDSETDKTAQQIAEEIDSPPQPSAVKYARKALDAAHGSSEAFAVVEMHDSTTDDPDEATTHLVFRVYHPGTQDEFFPQEPVTACYNVGFNFRGLVDEPHRTDCPAGAKPLDPPPIPVWEVPEGFDPSLQSVLTGLPASVAEKEVLAALARSMPAPPFDPETRTQGQAPLQDVALRGNDVGVAYRAGDRSAGGIDCLLGSRVDGRPLSGVRRGSKSSRANSRVRRRPHSPVKESLRLTEPHVAS
ncbi:hypothetical protein [Amycolatopsis sp. RTGN1]|uniref:hypothetical protein n=1 Tax=Amycolatopsis ponsaeliensis TaxID=2992142 RepID=UPI0025507897|nr:hypothetical protein [Amycolatopsis sp. RTGN1]